MVFFLKTVITYLCICFVCLIKAQQVPIYTQYVFNKAGVNPAASGTDINQTINYIFGIARTLTAFDNAPKQNFVNFSYTIRPPRSYHYWQNVGAYIETDQSGVMANNNIYASYAFHLLLNKNIVISFGVQAGFRKFLIGTSLLDANDPVVKKTNSYTYSYPDIIPGLRLSGKKFFFDICARQLTVIQQKGIFKKNEKQIGGPSYLNPNIYIAYGRFIPVSHDFVLLPSVAINNAILSVPNVDVNMMLYYNNLFGVGISARNINFIGGIFQLKILKNLSIGMAYSHSINALNSISPNSYELMIGVTPMGLNTKFTGNRAIARCPALEF